MMAADPIYVFLQELAEYENLAEHMNVTQRGSVCSDVSSFLLDFKYIVLLKKKTWNPRWYIYTGSELSYCSFFLLFILFIYLFLFWLLFFIQFSLQSWFSYFTLVFIVWKGLVLVDYLLVSVLVLVFF